MSSCREKNNPWIDTVSSWMYVHCNERVWSFHVFNFESLLGILFHASRNHSSVIPRPQLLMKIQQYLLLINIFVLTAVSDDFLKCSKTLSFLIFYLAKMGISYNNFPQSRWCLYPGHSKKPIELNSLKTKKHTKMPHLETSKFLDGLEELSIAVYIETSVIYENERSQQNIINIAQGLGSTADSVSPPNNNKMQSFNCEF